MNLVYDVTEPPPLPARPLWNVTLTVGGSALPVADVRAALERLATEQPFLLSGRYAKDRAEIRYWEEAEDCGDAASLALRLWGEHRRSAGLPAWAVLALEVVAQGVYQARGAEPVAPLSDAGAGGWRPF